MVVIVRALVVMVMAPVVLVVVSVVESVVLVVVPVMVISRLLAMVLITSTTVTRTTTAMAMADQAAVEMHIIPIEQEAIRVRATTSGSITHGINGAPTITGTTRSLSITNGATTQVKLMSLSTPSTVTTIETTASSVEASAMRAIKTLLGM